MRFLVDTQLPPKLSEFFIYKNFNSVHTQDYKDGIYFDDLKIINIAKSENRIIVTKDIDFFNHYILKGFPPKVLLLKLGNIPNNNLLKIMGGNFDKIIHKFNNNSELIILTKNSIISY